MEVTFWDEKEKDLMIDVSAGNDTERTTAVGRITVSQTVYDAVEEGTVGKGDVLKTAETAGLMGVKKTAELIPMCQFRPLVNCRIQFEMEPEECAIYCYCTVRAAGKAGAGMEALTGVSTALLTVYDMCKSMDPFMEIGGICLCRKDGGRRREAGNVKKGRKASKSLADLDIL